MLNVLFRWYDPIIVIVLGLGIGGFCYGFVPCLSYVQADSPCWIPGVIAAASAYHDVEAWIAQPDFEMIAWVGGAQVAIMGLLVGFRFFSRHKKIA